MTKCAAVTTSKISILAASKRTGKSRTTIAKHLKNGTLSAHVGNDGRKTIDVSELERVYGLKKNALKAGQGSANNSEPQRIENNTSLNAASLQGLLDNEKSERTRERDQLIDQIEFLKDALSTAQETTNRVTLLLEHQSTGNDGWDEKLSEAEQRIANRYETENKLLASAKEKELATLHEELKTERSRSLWSKLIYK